MSETDWWDLTNEIPSGKRLQFANWKMTIEIVDDYPLKNVIFHSYVSLPEGISKYGYKIYIIGILGNV